MNLNFRVQSEQSVSNDLPLVLIHGLFGSMDNLGVLARGLKDERRLIQLDMRNHGASGRATEMAYPLMAQDILDTLDGLQVERFDVVGHSMGGKIAMALAALAPERVAGIVAIDIAPVAYRTRHHDRVFDALRAVTAAGITRRGDAAVLMRDILAEEEGVIQFLLKSFHDGEWRFNVPALWQNYDRIIGWQPQPAWPHPVLFIRGELSPYLADEYRDELLAQFPQARAHVIAGAGHWVHAEKPDAVLRAIRRFFAL
ncbi:esterase [Erwinia amylovora]|uniref:esterase n=1 Tax=Erwinia amylovora TaxID=552 RepID=UPI00144462D8|nr:esterase [Erwinia amylovora]